MTIHSLVRDRCSLALAFFLCPALAGSALAQVMDATVQAQAQAQSSIASFGAGAGAMTIDPAREPARDYQPCKVRSRGPVVYPILADLNRVEGVVAVRFYVDETGKVMKTAVVRSPNALLDQVAGEPQLEQWTFDPAMLKGEPVPSTHDQEFEFRLDPEEQKRVALQRLSLAMGTPDPPYPPEAAARHLSGSVTVSVRWTKEGLVDHIGLNKSSGFPLLDNKALRFAYENWRIDPAASSPDKAFVKTIKMAPPR